MPLCKQTLCYISNPVYCQGELSGIYIPPLCLILKNGSVPPAFVIVFHFNGLFLVVYMVKKRPVLLSEGHIINNRIDYDDLVFLCRKCSELDILENGS